MREKARRLNRALNQIDIVYLANEKRKPISDGEYCFMYALDRASSYGFGRGDRLVYLRDL